MRRGSFTGLTSVGSPNEPLIVVEESGGIAEEEEDEDCKSSQIDSKTINEYLLTPWRDTRKRSLPTPPCTSGITASQVRRLSERGGEGSGPSPIEQAFLATLTQAPAPAAGIRRHSVVTISRAPPTSAIFGRNRRESIAAFAPGLPLRRDSLTNQQRGSIGGGGSNLHLDIMDDITEAKAKAKERRKMKRTQSKELTDENETGENTPLEGSKACDRMKTNPPALPKKRTSDLLPLNLGSSIKKPGQGVICTNTDLKSLLSPLTLSAQEISGLGEKETLNMLANPNTGSPTQQKSILDKKRKQLKDRSNSFDVGFLPGMSSGSVSWFTKRHQPIAKKDSSESKSRIIVTFDSEKQKPQTNLVVSTEKTKPKPLSPTSDCSQVVWDNRSGSVVDPQVLGSAIEVFLNRRTSQEPTSPVAKSMPTPRDSPTKNPSKRWFGTSDEEIQDKTGSDTCDSSICSTLKDLFVK